MKYKHARIPPTFSCAIFSSYLCNQIIFWFCPIVVYILLKSLPEAAAGTTGLVMTGPCWGSLVKGGSWPTWGELRYPDKQPHNNTNITNGLWLLSSTPQTLLIDYHRHYSSAIMVLSDWSNNYCPGCGKKQRMLKMKNACVLREMHTTFIEKQNKQKNL